MAVTALPCTIGGCPRMQRARGYCTTHLARLYRHGDPNTGASRAGQGYAKPGGYVIIGIKGHPLACGDRQNVYLHRAVLYDAIGPGLHGCYWCGCLITWVATEYSERLIVDHLDTDEHNNDRSNLVPSCHGCNLARMRLGAHRPLVAP